ncbi:MAG TPA: hypothetical protein VFP72_21575 [Kineosporiaceae bacterium]|nr:hypothetical protein [Kineosporiaceae bacterium]
MSPIYRARDDAPGELARLASDGLLRPVVGDVYVSPDTPDLPELRATALLLLLPVPLQDREPVIALEAAVWLETGGSAPDPVDVYVAVHGGRRNCPGLRIHEIRVDPRDVELIGGLRVTGPARTAADLCRTRPADQALDHLDRLCAETGLTPAAVSAVLGRLPRHPGVAGAREVVGRWAARHSR